MTFIDEAIKIAKRSDIRRHKTGAVIINPASKKILGNGWSHVPHYKLRSKRSLHAEMHALARARHHNLNGCIAYVATIATRSGNVVGAKPCLDCAIALKAAGIRTVYYTIGGVWREYLDLDRPSTFDDLKVYGINGD